MKSVQFFANTFAASVVGIFGYRAFAGLVETEKPYSADAFFAGGVLVGSLISLVLVACALRARYETTDMSLRLWCQNVVLALATFILASVMVTSWMTSVSLGITMTAFTFIIFTQVLREFRDSVEDYVNLKEFVLAPTMAFTILGTVGTCLFIDDHPLVAFGVMSVLMFFGVLASFSFSFGTVTVPENAIGVVVKTDPVAEPQKPASDAPGQIYDERV